jgi:hypothetical protein
VLENKDMTPVASSNATPKKRGAIRVVIIAGATAFALGLLSAFIGKAIAPAPNAPMASSASMPFTM